MADLNDYNQPTTTSTRVDVQDTNRAGHIRAITLDPGTASNRPTNAKKASFASSIFLLENWSGSAWVEWFRATVFGRSLVGSADNTAGRSVLGAGTTGDALFTAATASAARTTLGVAPQATRIDVASAGTLDLTANAPNTDDIRVTGTAVVTAVTVAAGRVFRVTFSGACTLTDGANIITQTGANLVTEAGATATFRAIAANTIEVLHYRGLATESQTGVARLASASEALALTATDRVLSPARLKDAFGVTGSAPMFACRAWVNFNGTGTVAIRASGNVSSITDNGVGDYTVNFTTAMPDANYAVVGIADRNGSVQCLSLSIRNDVAPTTNSVRVRTDQNGTALDSTYTCVSIFR